MDLSENGLRELTGEWVVGNDVWKRLKAERRIRSRAEAESKAPLLHQPSPLRNSSYKYEARVKPARHSSGSTTESSPALDGGSGTGTGTGSGAGEKVIYYIHGGAYYVGNAATHRVVTIGVSKACNARVFGELRSSLVIVLARLRL
jgi:acetyl esterase/lipase